MINKKIVLSSIVAGLIATSMTGCGGGNNNNNNNDGGTDNPTIDLISTISGSAVDGYVRNGLICLDVNNNNECDDAEPYAKTSTDGTYSLDISNVSETDRDGAKVLVSGGVDSATGRPFTGVLKAPLGSEAEVNVTPITTIVSAKVNSSADIDAAMQEVAATLNLSVDDVKSDPVKAQNKKVYEQALKIQKTLEILQEAVKQSASSTEAVENFVALAEKLAEGFDGNVADLNQIVDGTDFSQVAGLEDANLVKNVVKSVNDKIVINDGAVEEDLDKISYVIENLKEEVKQDIEYNKATNTFNETDFDETASLDGIDNVYNSFDEEAEKVKKMFDVIGLDIEDAQEAEILAILNQYQFAVAFNATLEQYRAAVNAISFSATDEYVKIMILDAIDKKALEFRSIDGGDDVKVAFEPGFKFFAVGAWMDTYGGATGAESTLGVHVEKIQLGESQINFDGKEFKYSAAGAFEGGDDSFQEPSGTTSIDQQIFSADDVARLGLADGFYKYETVLEDHYYEISGGNIVDQFQRHRHMRLKEGVWVVEEDYSNDDAPEAIVYNEDGSISVKDADGSIEATASLIVNEDISGKTLYVPVHGIKENIAVTFGPESVRYIIELTEKAEAEYSLFSQLFDWQPNAKTPLTSLEDLFATYGVGQNYNSLLWDNQEDGTMSATRNLYQVAGALADKTGNLVKTVVEQTMNGNVKVSEEVVGEWEIRQVNGVDTLFLSGYSVDKILSQHNDDRPVKEQAFIFTVVDGAVFQGDYRLSSDLAKNEFLYNETGLGYVQAAIKAYAAEYFQQSFQDIEFDFEVPGTI